MRDPIYNSIKHIPNQFEKLIWFRHLKAGFQMAKRPWTHLNSASAAFEKTAWITSIGGDPISSFESGIDFMTQKNRLNSRFSNARAGRPAYRCLLVFVLLALLGQANLRAAAADEPTPNLV